MKTYSTSKGTKAAVWNRNWTRAWQHGKCYFLPYEQKSTCLLVPVTHLLKLAIDDGHMYNVSALVAHGSK